MKDNIRTIVFAAILGFVCSLTLTGASLFTAPYRIANRKAEESRNFLSALEVPVPAKASAETLLELFEKNIRVKKMGSLALYEYVPATSASKNPVSIAVPFSGPGLWGPIKGVLALAPDMQTIRGIRFYEQEETPGLGGEIGSEGFQAQFVGKKIVSSSGVPGIKILKTDTSGDPNAVDAITGATMTCDRVQAMLTALATELQEKLKNDQ